MYRLFYFLLFLGQHLYRCLNLLYNTNKIMKTLLKATILSMFLGSFLTVSAQCPQKKCEKKPKCEKKCDKKQECKKENCATCEKKSECKKQCEKKQECSKKQNCKKSK